MNLEELVLTTSTTDWSERTPGHALTILRYREPDGHEVVAVLSRIGKVAAATTATTLIERFGVSRIVFTGVAGGLAPQVNVGDVVVAREFIQHDMDASPLFPRYEVPLTGRSHFPADAAMCDALVAGSQRVLQAPHAALARFDDRAFHGALRRRRRVRERTERMGEHVARPQARDHLFIARRRVVDMGHHRHADFVR